MPWRGWRWKGRETGKSLQWCHMSVMVSQFTRNSTFCSKAHSCKQHHHQQQHKKTSIFPIIVFYHATLPLPTVSTALQGTLAARGPFQYPIRRHIVKSRKVSKAGDRVLKYSYRFEIWQAPRQQCCRGACQISERSDNSKYKSRGFETLRGLTIRRLIGYWNGAQ